LEERRTRVETRKHCIEIDKGFKTAWVKYADVCVHSWRNKISISFRSLKLCVFGPMKGLSTEETISNGSQGDFRIIEIMREIERVSNF
jgi:hypothetical protein